MWKRDMNEMTPYFLTNHLEGCTKILKNFVLLELISTL